MVLPALQLSPPTIARRPQFDRPRCQATSRSRVRAPFPRCTPRNSNPNKRRTRALQRTAPGGARCHAGCFRLRLSATMQPARHPAPPSAVSELESLGVTAHLFWNGRFSDSESSAMTHFTPEFPDFRGECHFPASSQSQPVHSW